MAPSRGAARSKKVGLRPSLCVAYVATAYWIFAGESVRPESEYERDEVRRLAVTGNSHFEDFPAPRSHSASSLISLEADPPKDSSAKDSAPAATDTSCETRFLTPSNWGLSLHLGREANGGLAATAAETSSVLGIVKIAHAFRSSPAVIDSGQKGLYLRPALDAWTPHWIFNTSGCKFEGEVKLSLNETCEDGKRTVPARSIKGENGESIAFRLTAPRRMLVAARIRRENTSEVLSNQASEMQLYFCVKPGKHWEWHPLTLLWYFRDADGKSALALNPDESLIPHMFRGWRVRSGHMYSEPLADERGVPKCSTIRWNRFVEMEQEMEKSAAKWKSNGKAENTEVDRKRADLWKELQNTASQAVAGTPCEERNPKGMHPHSAILLEFARIRKPGQGPTVPQPTSGLPDETSSPGSKSTMHA